jgi:UDP-4-amino-4,6-dideoxy-N-acetyl-beta-L-altrosamine transaminase
MIPYGKQTIDDDDIRAVVNVLKSDWITTGPKIGEFEEALCKYTNAGYATVVNSGTSALDIAVQTLNLPKDSEAITTPFTFAATSNALLYNGVKPVFADILPDTHNINPDEVRKKITNKTRAIICVDFAGYPCDIRELKEIAYEHDLVLIEDACHALGAKYENRMIGSLADMTVLSFHPVKHITSGEGGAITTDNLQYHEKLQMLRSHGIDKNTMSRTGPTGEWAYDMKYLGRNYRMTDFQAALGISQMKKLDEFVRRRGEIAAYYNRELSTVEGITVPLTKPGIRHAWHIYTVLLKQHNRDDIFKRLRVAGIGVNVHYIPVYKFSYYVENLPQTEQFPVTEETYQSIITLPLYPLMTEEDADTVVSAVKTALEG